MCARLAGVSRVLLDLYESAGIRCGLPRFSENVGITRKKQHEREGATLCAARRTSRSTLWALTWSTPVCVDHQHLVWFGQVQRMPKYRGNAQNGIPGIVAGTDGACWFVEILNRVRRVIYCNVVLTLSTS